MKPFLLLSCLGALVYFLVNYDKASQHSNGDLNISHAISPQPPAVGAAIISVKVSDPAGEPVRGATVRVEGNMSHAGMVPIFAAAHEAEGGNYQADLQFTMVGDWILTIEVTTVDGERQNKEIGLRLEK